LSTIIRRETPEDIDKIDEVIASAFTNVANSDQTEQLIVKALRDSDALSVSLVAEDSEQIIGHVALSPVAISDQSIQWYGLGPIAVAPKKQRKGVGSKLMYEAIAALRALEANGCVLLGDPAYYHRFGFAPVDNLVLTGVPPEYFLARSFVDAFAQGEVSYHEAFFAKH